MTNIDCILIAASESVQYDKYSQLPLDRIELFQNLVQMRMTYYENGFHSVLDLLNKIRFGKYFHEADYPLRREMYSIWNLPSLNGILAVNPLVNSGYNCKVIQNFDAEYDLLIQSAEKMDVPIICISTTFILNWSETGRICKKIRSSIPNAILILGGPFINDQMISYGTEIFKEHMSKNKISYALFGYHSETDLHDLILSIKGSKDVKDVNNLAYFNDSGQYCVTESKWYPPEVNSLALWNMHEINPYGDTIQLRTSVGCPFACAFCSYSSSSKKYTLADLECVKKQLDMVASMSNVKAVIFVDDNLNVPKTRFNALLDLLNNYRFRWYAFLRVQFIDEETAKKMKDSGCDGVYLGLESGSDEILVGMNKKSTTEKYLNGIRHLKRNGIPTFASFIIGFPGETEETIQETINFINESGLDYFSLKEWFFLKNSPIYDQREKYDLKGEGNVWSHKTMDSITASALKNNIFLKVDKSIHIDPDTGLWLLAYLRSREFSWDQISVSMSTFNEMIKRDNYSDWLNKSDCFKTLQMSILE